MKKRILAILLALCMVCSLLPTVVLAEEEVTSGTFMGRTNEVTWEFKEGTLYITCDDYCIDDAPWEHLQEGIESIVFSGSLTLVGSVFQNFPNLKSITWPKDVSALMDFAFYGCPRLESITIPDSVYKITSSAFSNCATLSYVKLPSGLEELYGAFGSTPCLDTVVLPGNKLNIISGAFNGSGLTNITIPASVKTIGEGTFSLCHRLENIIFLGNAPEIHSNAFQGVEATVYYPSGNSTWTAANKLSYSGNLTWVGVEDPSKVELNTTKNWKVHDGVLTISGSGEMNDTPWAGVSAYIDTVIIENGVTSIADSAFYDFEQLTSVNIPDSVTHIGSDAFSCCYSLSELTIPDSVVSIGDAAFYRCENLIRVNIPKNLTILSTNLFSNCESLPSISLHSNVKEIRSRAFSGCRSITSMTIPASVTYIGEYAFDSASSLTEIYFEGDAPTFDGNYIFNGITLTAYYPPNNATWTADVMQDYWGNVTWVPTHEHEYTAVVTAPTCAEQGFTTHTCTVCEDSYIDTYVDALGHNFDEYIFDEENHSHSAACTRCDATTSDDCTFDEGKVTTEATPSNLGTREYTCTVCGGSYEETYVCRIFGSSRYDTGYAVADALKAQLGVEEFDNVIVASGLGYADALAASYLAAVKEAPILLVNERRMEEVADYIRENLDNDGMIYLIGGEGAIPVEMEEILDGFNMKRLSGKNRYETNMAILEEAGTDGQEILICTGRDFPDSLSASAVGKPILLVNKTLYDYQKEFLENSSGEFVIIGGTGAVSEDIEKELEEFGEITRLGGSGRYETCVMVAEYFFPEGAEAAIVAYSRNFPDGLCGGPLAYAMNAPLLLLQTDRGPEVIEYANETGIEVGAVLGGESLIDDATVNKVFVE